MPRSIRQFKIEDPLDNTRLAGMDNIHKGLLSIDIPSHKVHEAEVFEVMGTNLILGNEDTLILAFKTPSGSKRIHLLSIGFGTLAGGYVNILEGPTWTQGTGTLQTIFNMNRTTPIPSSILLEDQGQPTFTASDAMILDPTITDNGTVFHPFYAFGSENNTPSPLRGQSKRLLNVNTTYAIKLTSTSANNQGQVGALFYEHTDE